MSCVTEILQLEEEEHHLEGNFYARINMLNNIHDWQIASNVGANERIKLYVISHCCLQTGTSLYSLFAVGC